MRKAHILTHVLPPILAIAALLASRPGAAAALLNEATYTLNWWTVDGGGTTFAEGSGYTLGATTGQPDAGRLQSSSYTLNGGFWAGTAAMQRLYLPLILGRTEESEPNDTPAQANGPIAAVLTYYGTMPEGDPNNYFYFNPPTTGSAELWLTHIPSDCGPVLRNAALVQVGYSGKVDSTEEHISASELPAGHYYVQTYRRSAAGSSQTYHLQVTHP